MPQLRINFQKFNKQFAFINYLKIMSKMEQQMLERIRSRISGHGALDQLTHLCLDEIIIKKFSPCINEELTKLSKLEFLTLNKCQLQDLEETPQLENLLGFEAMNNKLTGKNLLAIKNKFPNLLVLALDNNHLNKIQDFQKLKEMPQLQLLEIRGNSVCRQEGYRQKLFQMLPNLKRIDGIDKFGDSADTESSGSMLDDSNFSQNSLDDQENLDDGEYEENNEEEIPQPPKKFRQI